MAEIKITVVPSKQIIYYKWMKLVSEDCWIPPNANMGDLMFDTEEEAIAYRDGMYPAEKYPKAQSWVLVHVTEELVYHEGEWK